MKKIILTLTLLSSLAFSDVKFKFNPTGVVAGIINIKTEIDIGDYLSVEPTITFIKSQEEDGEDYYKMYGINAYYYFETHKKNGWFASAGAGIYDKPDLEEDKIYNANIGYLYGAKDDIQFTVEFGALNRGELTVPMIHINIGIPFISY
jgi:hypothetical protein